MGQVSTQKMGYRRFAILHRQLHAESFTALWLDSDTFSPPSPLQNNRTCFGEVFLKRKIYSRQLDEKVREQIHSVSSTTVTMHIEEAALSVLTSKWVSEPPHFPLTSLGYIAHWQTYGEGVCLLCWSKRKTALLDRQWDLFSVERKDLRCNDMLLPVHTRPSRSSHIMC